MNVGFGIKRDDHFTVSDLLINLIYLFNLASQKYSDNFDKMKRKRKNLSEYDSSESEEEVYRPVQGRRGQGKT